MNEVKNKYEKKETVQNYMRNNPNEKELKYYWTIGFILFELTMIILFFTIGMSDFKMLKQNFSIMNSTGMILIFLYLIPILIFWFYAIFSILKNNFKRDTDKITWLVGTIFVPLVFAFYLDFKGNILEND